VYWWAGRIELPTLAEATLCLYREADAYATEQIAFDVSISVQI
jgi:hypothetical protein